MTNLIPTGTKPRPGIAMPTQDVESITIHWIGPFPGQSAQDPIDYWVKNDLEASAHFVIKDDVCINCIPVNEVAWHCGDAHGNRHSIGIEVVPMNTAGEFSPASIASLKALIQTSLPKVPLKRHFDWTSKDCPRFYTPKDGPEGDARWEALVKELTNETA